MTNQHTFSDYVLLIMLAAWVALWLISMIDVCLMATNFTLATGIEIRWLLDFINTFCVLG